MKLCADCGEREPYRGYRVCLRCRNKRYVERHGIEAERERQRIKSRRYWAKKRGEPEGWYEEQLAKQNGKCAICQTDNPQFGNSTRFHVDHDHKTGKLRGLLCDRCNKGIGMLKDDAAIIESALAYLKAFA